MMKLRLATSEHLIDLAGVAELKGIRADGDDIVIGAMTTQHDLRAVKRENPSLTRDIAGDRRSGRQLALAERREP
jgi:CO/xanthine dehydrogenase FAD-binding subunit